MTAPSLALVDQPAPFIITISGSRTIRDSRQVQAILDEEATYYLCLGHDLHFRLGDAIGVDKLALDWARERQFPRRIYFADRAGYEFWQGSSALRDTSQESAVLAADWDKDGKQAGMLRNSAMIGAYPHGPRADLLVAIWDGSSPGTRNCMAAARNANVFIHQWGGGAPIELRTPMPRDAALIDYRGEPSVPGGEPG